MRSRKREQMKIIKILNQEGMTMLEENKKYIRKYWKQKSSINQRRVGRTHEWYTPVDPLTWTSKGRTTSWNLHTTALCAGAECSLEDLTKAMDDRQGWRERVRKIRADGATRWWWWWHTNFSKPSSAAENISKSKYLCNSFYRILGNILTIDNGWTPTNRSKVKKVNDYPYGFTSTR